MNFRRRCQVVCRLPDAMPLTAVLFLLLLFALLQAPGMSVNLPALEGQLPATSDPVLAVAVDRSGQVYFRNQRLPVGQLRAALSKARENLGGRAVLMLRADRDTAHESLARIARHAREAGIQQVWLATRPNLFTPSKP